MICSIIPAEIYKDIMKEFAPVANYTNELMATRFSDVMWLIEQIICMWYGLLEINKIFL